MAYQGWESFKVLCSICHTKRLWAHLEPNQKAKKEGLSSWELEFAALWSWLCLQSDTDFDVIFASYLQTTKCFPHCTTAIETVGGCNRPQGVPNNSALKVKDKIEETLGERYRWFNSFSVLAFPIKVPKDLPGILFKISHPFVMAESSDPQKGITEYGNLCCSSYTLTWNRKIAYYSL